MPALTVALAMALGSLMSSGCADTSFSNGSAAVAQAVQTGIVAASSKEATATPVVASSAVARPVGAAAPTQPGWDPDDTLSFYAAIAGDAVEIRLGSTITVAGPGATVAGSGVTISGAGTYSISGTLKDGQIVVDTLDKETVRLVLNGVDISCSTSAPIYVKSAKKTVIILADGTENYVKDGNSYTIEDPASNEPNAAIFSKDDLTITGNGSLTINANYKHGIVSKDELKITAGHVTVTAAADGIRGRDFIAVTGGNITVNAKNDGMQSNNDEDPEKGFVFIEGGTLNVTAGLDGIQAETRVIVTGGDIAVTSGGGSPTTVRGTTRAPGAMGNTTSGDGAFPPVGRPGQNTGVNNYLYINGGYIVVDSMGDGLDVNGTITMTGGVVIVNGPTASMNGAIDFDRGFKITGGTLIAVGSSGMAQAPDTSSTQNSVMVNLAAPQPAGAIVHIITQSGEEVLTFVPTRTYQSVVLSSPVLKSDTTYVVYTGGSSTGSVTDGVYSGGKYTPGTQTATLAISGVVTTSGAATRGGFPGGPRR